MNSFTFVGNLGKDPELKFVGGESIPVLEFSVANNIYWKKEKRTQWISCSIWGDRGKSLLQYLKKGTKVTVIGKLFLDSYLNRDKKDIPVLRCNVVDISMHTTKPKEEQGEDNYAPDNISF